MIETAFFDTNVLIYIHDLRAPKKMAIAEALFGRHCSEKREVLSTQVLQEYYVNITRKTARLPLWQARSLVAHYMRLNVVIVQPLHILQAIDLHIRFRLSFWDGLILATAKSAGASILFSEDFTHGRTYDGVRVENPFHGLLN